MLWMVATGVQFTVMNALLKRLSHELDPWMVGWLRYSLGALIMLPMVLRLGTAALWPRLPVLHFGRGATHALGLLLWFAALPMTTLAELTAIGFSAPLFVCVGAVLFLGERMSAARWSAVLMGFGGVLLTVQPWQGGFGGISTGMLLLLGAAPAFATSLLISKALTRQDRPDVIVLWQHLWVGVLLLPLAVAGWTSPTAGQWVLLVLCAMLGTSAHYCNMRAISVADISAVQSVKFLDLVWAALLGVALFGNMPAAWTVAGGVLILFSTLWLARREARGT